MLYDRMPICPECRKFFSNRKKLNRHLILRHGYSVPLLQEGGESDAPVAEEPQPTTE
jgi:hypothetical protein